MMFFYEFCEISENTFFTEHIWTTASIMIVSLEAHPENLRKRERELLTLVTNSVFRHGWETKTIFSVSGVYS